MRRAAALGLPVIGTVGVPARFATRVLKEREDRRRRIRVAYKSRAAAVDETELLKRVTVNPKIFGGKPIIRGMRIAVEHVLGMLAAGATAAEIVEHYPYLEEADVRACLVYARRVVGRERYEPAFVDSPH